MQQRVLLWHLLWQCPKVHPTQWGVSIGLKRWRRWWTRTSSLYWFARRLESVLGKLSMPKWVVDIVRTCASMAAEEEEEVWCLHPHLPPVAVLETGLNARQVPNAEMDAAVVPTRVGCSNAPPLADIVRTCASMVAEEVVG